MQSLRDVKKRIRSTKNIAQITKAMEMVSMNKMRKSQLFALESRPYAIASLEMLRNLMIMSPVTPALLKTRAVTNSLLLIVTSDKGLAGAFNENVLKKADAWQVQEMKAGHTMHFITVGKKAKEYADRKGLSLVASHVGFGDFSKFEQTSPIADAITEGFLSKKWDSVDAVYTNFFSTLRQETALRKVLPVTEGGIEEIVSAILPTYGKFSELREEGTATKPKYNYEYIFEPSPDKILERLVPELLQMHVHHIVLESNASEHSARMVAMKSASDNASELKDELTLEYNKGRQSAITAQLSEIVAGAEALQK